MLGLAPKPKGWMTMMVDPKSVARRYYVGAFFLLLFPSCTGLSSARSLEEVKASLDCVTYSDDLQWEQIAKPFGRADETPIPVPGSLFGNTRVYKDKIVIFYVDSKEMIEAGRSKFVEVVKRIEVCKER